MSFVRNPKFGWDPWLNDATHPARMAMAATDVGFKFSGADTIGGDIGLLPAGLNMYGSYVDNFGGYPQLVQRFGTNFAGLLLSITIFGNAARCADCEPGAMASSSLPHWLDFTALKTATQLPWVYTSASNMNACNAQIGSRKVVRWSAHYGFGMHICGPATCGYPQADWTQWTDTGPNGQNYDRSVGNYMPTSEPTTTQAWDSGFNTGYDLEQKRTYDQGFNAGYGGDQNAFNAGLAAGTMAANQTAQYNAQFNAGFAAGKTAAGG